MKNLEHIGLVLSFVPGYSETFFKNKIQGLIEKGYKVTLLVDYKPNHTPNTDYKIVVAPNFHSGMLIKVLSIISTIFRTFLFNPSKSFRLYHINKSDGRNAISSFKNVLINAHILERDFSWLHYGFGTLASDNENVAKAIGAKMGVSFRGFDLYLSPLKHPGCFNALFKKDVRYHVLSEEMKQDLYAYDVSLESIKVITPAIDVDFFQPTQQREKNSKLQLLTVSRLHWKKGLVYTLEALAILKCKGVDFKYTVIGEGSELERLLFAVHQLGLECHVEFKGKLSQKEIRSNMASTDLYLQYSIQEGFCNSVLEAQAMGLLCLVSDAEGLTENVLNTQTGWVVAKRKPELLADKIQEVLNMSADIKNEIRNNAIQRVNNDFNLEKQRQKWQNFFS